MAMSEIPQSVTGKWATEMSVQREMKPHKRTLTIAGLGQGHEEPLEDLRLGRALVGHALWVDRFLLMRRDSRTHRHVTKSMATSLVIHMGSE